MSALKNLISEFNQGKSIFDAVFKKPTLDLAKRCGSEEVNEILDLLDVLSIQKSEIDRSDYDSKDDIWRIQEWLSELLVLILPRYSIEICRGLKSQQRDTAFFVAIALGKKPNSTSVDALKEYLQLDLLNHERKLAQEALEECMKKRGFIGRFSK